jgi:CheY-like chemotaxis protein
VTTNHSRVETRYATQLGRWPAASNQGLPWNYRASISGKRLEESYGNSILTSVGEAVTLRTPPGILPLRAGDLLLSTSPCVLIVDESDESREVLSELLERHGAVAVGTDSADKAAELTCEHRPDIIVFDVESDHSDCYDASRRLAVVAKSNETPVIVLGSVRRGNSGLPSGQFVAKPYHYGPLLRKIEGLLAAG